MIDISVTVFVQEGAQLSSTFQVHCILIANRIL